MNRLQPIIPTALALGSMSIRSECIVLNVIVDNDSFTLIEKGEQKVVFESFNHKQVIENWYDESISLDKWLVIKVWKDAMKSGNSILLFQCEGIWDTDNWSWFGWLPNERNFDEFGEPSGDHFVLYLGERVDFAKKA